jgi:hypothetical protein
MAPLGALHVGLNALGFTSRSLRAQVSHLLGRGYTGNQMSYDLGRPRLNGLIERLEGTNTYRLTSNGQRVATFYTKVHRLLRPLLAANAPPAPVELRTALGTIDRHVCGYIDAARARERRLRTQDQPQRLEHKGAQGESVVVEPGGLVVIFAVPGSCFS